MLLDSNIIIYAAMPKYQNLRELIARHTPKVSVISQIEVLGYHQLSAAEQKYFGLFFATSTILSLNKEIINRSILLKQQQKISLGDAIIAATALEQNLQLVTRNSKDFAWIDGLEIVNPIPYFKTGIQ